MKIPRETENQRKGCKVEEPQISLLLLGAMSQFRVDHIQIFLEIRYLCVFEFHKSH